MIKYYTNRQLSLKLEIKLAKWKRWSREFLPPDPLGGLQSGYARHYHPDEAFGVYLGGVLVSELKFSIPEAKRILGDLAQWFENNGFCFNAETLPEPSTSQAESYYLIKVFSDREQGFWYEIRRIGTNAEQAPQEMGINTEGSAKFVIDPLGIQKGELAIAVYRVMNISFLLEEFLKRLDLSSRHYYALAQAP